VSHDIIDLQNYPIVNNQQAMGNGQKSKEEALTNSLIHFG